MTNIEDIKVDKALAERPQFAVIKVACKVWKKVCIARRYVPRVS